MDFSKAFNFEDVYLPSVTYRPVNEKKVTKKNFSGMTQNINMEDAEANTDHPENNIAIQTEDLYAELIEDESQIDEEDLGRFMKRSLPRLLQAVIENETSQAFAYYDVMANLHSSDNQCLYTLHNKENALYERDNQLEITDVSWNSTGLILAASFGKFEHDGMCYDRSFLYAWNLQKRGFKVDEPMFSIETSACIMCIEFHPTRPSIIAGGSFNGEVFVWDVSRDDENLLYFSRIDDYFHREAVSQILWLEQKLVGRADVLYNIMTVSTDGKALIWNLEHKLKYPSKGYSLVRKREGSLSYVGALSVSQSCEEKTCFILGTEVGSIFQLKVNPMLNMDKRQKMLFEQKNEYNVRWKDEAFPVMFNLITKNMPEIKMHVESYCAQRKFPEVKSDYIFQSKPDMRKMYPNPIFSNYESSTGSVYSVNCSPFHRSGFLTASLDGTVKLFDTASIKPVLTFEQSSYVFKVEWSPSRPLVFATASGNGDVCIYDLNEKKKGPVNILRFDEETHRSAVTLRFNKNQKDLLAVGYSGGKIRIYQLSQMLCEPGNDELSTLNSILTESKQ